MANITNLTAFLTDVANAIRQKEKSTGTILASEFDTRILELPGKTQLDYVVPSVSKPPTVQYGFEKGTDGYYAATNLGVHSSFSYATVYFKLTEVSDVEFEYVNYGENNFDFLLFSNIDAKLSENTSDITTNVFKSCKGESSTSVKTLVYSDVPAGIHYITIKARKDGSGTETGEVYKFKSSIIGTNELSIPYVVLAFQSLDELNSYDTPQLNNIGIVFDNENNYMFLYDNGWIDITNRPVTKSEYDELCDIATLIATEKEVDAE